MSKDPGVELCDEGCEIKESSAAVEIEQVDVDGIKAQCSIDSNRARNAW